MPCNCIDIIEADNIEALKPFNDIGRQMIALFEGQVENGQARFRPMMAGGLQQMSQARRALSPQEDKIPLLAARPKISKLRER